MMNKQFEKYVKENPITNKISEHYSKESWITIKILEQEIKIYCRDLYIKMPLLESEQKVTIPEFTETGYTEEDIKELKYNHDHFDELIKNYIEENYDMGRVQVISTKDIEWEVVEE